MLLLFDEREEDEEDDSDEENVVDRVNEKLVGDIVALIEMLCMLDNGAEPVAVETLVLVVPGEEVEVELRPVVPLLELRIEIFKVFEDEAFCEDKVRGVEDVVESPELCFMLDVTLLSLEEDFADEL